MQMIRIYEDSEMIMTFMPSLFLAGLVALHDCGEEENPLVVSLSGFVADSSTRLRGLRLESVQEKPGAMVVDLFLIVDSETHLESQFFCFHDQEEKRLQCDRFLGIERLRSVQGLSERLETENFVWAVQCALHHFDKKEDNNENWTEVIVWQNRDLIHTWVKTSKKDFFGYAHFHRNRITGNEVFDWHDMEQPGRHYPVRERVKE